MIDAFAHIVPPRFFARLERLLETWQPSERVKLYRSWLREDEVLGEPRRALAAARSLRRLPPGARARRLPDGGARRRADLGRARARGQRRAGRARARPPGPLRRASPPSCRSTTSTRRSRSSSAAVASSARSARRSTPTCRACRSTTRAFEPLFAKVHELDRTIWLHPARSSIWTDYPTEDRVALRHLVVARLALRDRRGDGPPRLLRSHGALPGLKIITHHGGGMIPHFSGRLDAIQTDDQREVFEQVFKRPALDYFRMFFADTAFFGAPHARPLVGRVLRRRPRPVRHRHAARRPAGHPGHGRGHPRASACPPRTSARSCRATPSACWGSPRASDGRPPVHITRSG